TEQRVCLGFEPLGRQRAYLGQFSACTVGNVRCGGNALAQLRGKPSPGRLSRPAARLDRWHAVGTGARELWCVREPRGKRRERGLLGVGDRRHQIEIFADRVADSSRGGELPQSARACGKRTKPFRQSNPWNRQLGESLNLTGFENARHAWSRQIRLDDASAPSLVSRSPAPLGAPDRKSTRLNSSH